MNKTRWAAVTAAIVVASAALLTFAQERKCLSGKKPPGKVIPIVAQTSILNGQTVITMSAQAEKLTGIVTAPLKTASGRNEITAPAMVLGVGGLAKLRASHIATAAQLAKAHAQMDVASKEYARLKTLYAKDQNVSLKALQLGEGTLRSDQVDVQAAQQELALEGLMVKESWGGVVEQWMKNNDPRLERVLEQKEMLVEMTVPAGKTSDYPSKVQMEIPGGHHAEASFVSLFPHVDPRIQGVGLLYRTSARAGLAPGTNLVAHYSAGALKKGVVVPRSAVVWWHGKAWAYQETQPGRFTRRLVPTTIPARSGWFVKHGLAPGDLVVTRGAEQLLSIEDSLVPSSRGGQSQGEGDEN